MAGLGSSGNGLLGGTGTGKGGGGDMAKWYAGQIASKLSEALRNHPKTRAANFRVSPQFTIDSSGRVRLSGSTGDRALDEALNDILPRLQLAEPPPKGMRMMSFRLTATRPR
jgi:hypothetical protein